MFLLLMFHFCFCYAALPVPCSFETTCWENEDLLALLYLYSTVFITFPYGIQIQVWYLTVSISDICFDSLHRSSLLMNIDERYNKSHAPNTSLSGIFKFCLNQIVLKDQYMKNINTISMCRKKLQFPIPFDTTTAITTSK